MVKSAFVLSDIHLGAASSILTYYESSSDGQSLVEREFAQTILNKLIEDLREITFGEKIQQCILLGDIFDLSFAPYGLAMQNGRWFFEQLVAANLFEEFVYIPGNHDHHLWQQITEHYYLMSDLRHSPVQYPRTLPAHMVLNNTFLDDLLPEGMGFQVTYPNYSFAIASKMFYLHHGHYLQKLYIAASQFLEETLYTKDIEDLELLNAPFLELGWYNLGQAYNLGQKKLLDRLYFLFKNRQTGELDKLLRFTLRKLEKLGQPATAKRWPWWDRLVALAIQWVGPYVIKRFFWNQRRLLKTRRQASTGRHKRVGEALQTAVMSYLEKYLLPENPDFKSCTFIFGHTHEPEHNVVCEDARGIRYHLYNTGGWIVDEMNETGGLKSPKISPIYIGTDGTLTPLNFTHRHEHYIRRHLDSEPVFQAMVKAHQDL